MIWQIWYKGGATVAGTSEQDWKMAPDSGIICVGIQFGRNKNGIMLGEICSGSDWYWMYNGKIYQSGTTSEIVDDWLEHGAPEHAILKKGKWVSDLEMHNTTQDVTNWVK